MSVIVTIEQLQAAIASAHQHKKKVVLVGGVFDILHYGHVHFLEAAKRIGDVLVVALEPDSSVQRIKGNDRPIHDETKRAHVIAAVRVVDYVIILPELRTDVEYANFVNNLAPDCIAVTEGDPQIQNKQKQMQALHGTLQIVTPKLETPSTTRLIKLLTLD